MDISGGRHSLGAGGSLDTLTACCPVAPHWDLWATLVYLTSPLSTWPVRRRPTWSWPSWSPQTSKAFQGNSAHHPGPLLSQGAGAPREGCTRRLTLGRVAGTTSLRRWQLSLGVRRLTWQRGRGHSGQRPGSGRAGLTGGLSEDRCGCSVGWSQTGWGPGQGGSEPC